MFWDIAVIVFSVIVVAGVIVRSVIRKKQGKSSCCDCSSYSACSACRKTEEDKNAQ